MHNEQLTASFYFMSFGIFCVVVAFTTIGIVSAL